MVDDNLQEHCQEMPKEKPKQHYVCKGVTLTSKKKMLLSGECVCEGDLSGGKKALDQLLIKGKIELR